jgi:hypothetical protein
MKTDSDLKMLERVKWERLPSPCAGHQKVCQKCKDTAALTAYIERVRKREVVTCDMKHGGKEPCCVAYYEITGRPLYTDPSEEGGGDE